MKVTELLNQRVTALALCISANLVDDEIIDKMETKIDQTIDYIDRLIELDRGENIMHLNDAKFDAIEIINRIERNRSYKRAIRCK